MAMPLSAEMPAPVRMTMLFGPAMVLGLIRRLSARRQATSAGDKAVRSVPDVIGSPWQRIDHMLPCAAAAASDAPRVERG